MILSPGVQGPSAAVGKMPKIERGPVCSSPRPAALFLRFPAGKRPHWKPQAHNDEYGSANVRECTLSDEEG